jgi:D-alanyl-D-alanine-carboxypeptidase/D-alanyl-D-alanine-endopeptidase
MKLGYLLIVLIIGSCTTAQEIKRIDDSSIESNQLTRRIEKLAKDAKVAGLAVTIFNNNQPVYQKVFGSKNLQLKDTLDIHTIFYGASLSKIVFAHLVMQLVEEGIIDLDKPIQQYLKQPLPEMKFEQSWRGFSDLKGDERYKLITGRMCLAHTTGFPNWRWLTDKGLDENGKLYFQSDPGTKYSYSGEGIRLLQIVIEQITGRGLEELAREKIFDPLQMNMTSYTWQQRFENKFCNGHTVSGEVIPKDREYDAGAAGSMETTPADFARFLTGFMSRQLLKEASFVEMTTPQIRIKSKQQFGPEAKVETDAFDKINLSYGLGCGLLKTKYGTGVFKEGHGEGFQHYFIFFPEQKTGILIMTNSDNGESIFKELLELTIADYFTPWQWENYIPFNTQRK